MNLENLYDLVDKENIKVYEWHIEDANGIYINIDKINAIALNYDNLGTYIKEKQILAEELGHYYMDATYSPYCNNLQLISRQEYRAKKWAYYALIPYEKLKSAIKNGVNTVYYLAEYFDVTAEYMQKALEFYKEKYGDLTNDEALEIML